MSFIDSTEVEALIGLLRTRKMTTAELMVAIKSVDSQCPDDMVRILTGLRRGGRIHGWFSSERNAWEWWAD